MAAQIILLSIMFLNLLTSAFKHGEEKPMSQQTYHAGYAIVNFIIIIVLLWWGGFLYVFF